MAQERGIREGGEPTRESRSISRPAGAPPDDAPLQEVERWLRHRRTESAYGFDPATGRKVWERHTDSMEVPLTEADRAWLKGMVFTHNHPRGWAYPEGDPRRAGSAFSPHDIHSAALAGMAEVRAVAPGFLFTMRLMEKGLWPAPEHIGPMYLREEEAYRRQALQRVVQGMLSITQDQANAAHAVWSRLAPIMGLIYRREEVGKVIDRIADANQDIPLLSPVCTFCRHQSAYRRCAAFPDGIPLAIWLGRDTHQAPYPGDHGIRFAPVPGAVVTTPQVIEGDKVLWPLIDQEESREPQPV